MKITWLALAGVLCAGAAQARVVQVVSQDPDEAVPVDECRIYAEYDAKGARVMDPADPKAERFTGIVQRRTKANKFLAVRGVDKRGKTVRSEFVYSFAGKAEDGSESYVFSHSTVFGEETLELRRNGAEYQFIHSSCGVSSADPRDGKCRSTLKEVKGKTCPPYA